MRSVLEYVHMYSITQFWDVCSEQNKNPRAFVRPQGIFQLLLDVMTIRDCWPVPLKRSSLRSGDGSGSNRVTAVLLQGFHGRGSDGRDGIRNHIAPHGRLVLLLGNLLLGDCKRLLHGAQRAGFLGSRNRLGHHTGLLDNHFGLCVDNRGCRGLGLVLATGRTAAVALTDEVQVTTLDHDVATLGTVAKVELQRTLVRLGIRGSELGQKSLAKVGHDIVLHVELGLQLLTLADSLEVSSDARFLALEVEGITVGGVDGVAHVCLSFFSF